MRSNRRIVIFCFSLILFPPLSLRAQQENPPSVSEWSVSFESSLFLSPWRSFNEYYKQMKTSIASNPDVSDLQMHVGTVNSMIEWGGRIRYRFSENASISGFFSYSGRETGVQAQYHWRTTTDERHARDFWFEEIAAGLGYSLEIELTGGVRGFVGADLGLARGMLDVTYQVKRVVNQQSGNLDRYSARLGNNAVMVSPRVGVVYRISSTLRIEGTLTYRFLTFSKLTGGGTGKVSVFDGNLSIWTESHSAAELVGDENSWKLRFDPAFTSLFMNDLDGVSNSASPVPFDLSALGISFSVLWML